MERVKTLTEKLNQQLQQNASANAVLQTVQMLHSELTHLIANAPEAIVEESVSLNLSPIIQVDNPVHSTDTELTSTTVEKIVEQKPLEPIEEPKIVEVLQIDEAEVEAELDEIKRAVEERNKISAQNKPNLLFDPIDDIPTLTHQQPKEPVNTRVEINQHRENAENTSLNDRLKQAKVELSDTLQETPIKDLKKGIGLNDRFLFINELFRGDETMYERSIKTINGFTILPEAEYWIRRELKLKLGWDEKNATVKQFDQLVRRRFA